MLEISRNQPSVQGNGMLVNELLRRGRGFLCGREKVEDVVVCSRVCRGLRWKDWTVVGCEADLHKLGEAFTMDMIHTID